MTGILKYYTRILCDLIVMNVILSKSIFIYLLIFIDLL